MQQQQKGEGLTSQVEGKVVDKLSPVLQEEEGLKDHVTSKDDDIAMEPVESGCGQIINLLI